MQTKNYKYKKFPAFKDHSNCQGHANYYLDCEYENEDERELLISILDRRIKQNEKELSKA